MMTLRKLFYLFFISGFSAIIYQIAWQRVLFTSFGTNVEAVTIIVAVFMFGLGIGSLIGGQLSKIFDHKLLELFVLFEFGIGCFGIISISLIQYMNTITSHAPGWALPFVIFGILCIPTLAMGATLPILIAYLHKKSHSVGDAVSELYYINTLGSAIACLVTATLLFRLCSLSTVTYIAAFLNFAIAGITYFFLRPKQRPTA